MPSGLEGSGRANKSSKRKRTSPRAPISRKTAKQLPSESLETSIHTMSGTPQTVSNDSAKITKKTKSAPNSDTCRATIDGDVAGLAVGQQSEVDHLQVLFETLTGVSPEDSSVTRLLKGMSSKNMNVVVSSLEKLNDFLNMSSDDAVYRLPMDRTLPKLFSLLSVSNPHANMLSARILSLIFDSSPPNRVFKYVSNDAILTVCAHISNLLVVELADQCVVILSRMCRIPGVVFPVEVGNAVLKNLEFFCIATQRVCLQVVDHLDSQSVENLARLAQIVESHTDSDIVATAARCWADHTHKHLKTPTGPILAYIRKALLDEQAVKTVAVCLRGLASIGAHMKEDHPCVEFLCEPWSRLPPLAICREVLSLYCGILPGLVLDKKSGKFVLARIVYSTSLFNAACTFAELVAVHYSNLSAPFCVQLALIEQLATGKIGVKFDEHVAELLSSSQTSKPVELACIQLFASSSKNEDRLGIRQQISKRCKKASRAVSWNSLISNLASRVFWSTSAINSSESHVEVVHAIESALLADEPNFDLQKLGEDFVQLLNRPLRVALDGSSSVTIMIEPFATVGSLGEFLQSRIADENQYRDYMDDSGDYGYSEEPDYADPVWSSDEEGEYFHDGTWDNEHYNDHYMNMQLERQRTAARAEPPEPPVIVPVDPPTTSVSTVRIFDNSGRLLSPESTLLEALSQSWVGPLAAAPPAAPLVFGERIDLVSLPLVANIEPFVTSLWGPIHHLRYEQAAETVTPESPPKPCVSKLDAQISDLVRAVTTCALSGRLSDSVTEYFSNPLFLSTGKFPAWIETVQRMCPWILSVAARRDLFVGKYFGNLRSVIPRLPVRLTTIARQKIKLNRKKLIESALLIMKTFSSNRETILEMEFLGEEGTGSGPTNEFYSLVSGALVNEAGLFRRCRDGGLFPANAAADRWNLIGFLVGRALLDSRLIGLDFSPLFWDCVKGAQEQSLFGVDPVLANSLSKLKSMTSAELKSIDASVMPGDESVRFAESETPLTKKMVPEYVLNVTRTSLNVQTQIEAFKEGFAKVLPLECLNMWGNDEISSLVCGASNEGNDEYWTPKHLHTHIQAAHGYTRESTPVVYFREVLAELDATRRVEFIKFVTGSGSLPIGGFAGLKPLLTVVKVSTNEGDINEYLPSVMTCAHFVKLPEYTCKETLKKQLMRAISEGQGSFLLS